MTSKPSSLLQVSRALSVAFAVHATASAMLAQDSAKTYRVEVFFDRRLTDTDSSIEALTTLARLLPPTKVAKVEGDDPAAALIRKHYGLGVSQLPRTYEMLEREISRLNLPSENAAIESNEILIPTLPRWSPPRGYNQEDTTLGYRRDLEKNRRLLAIEATETKIATPSSSSAAVDSDVGRFYLSDAWLKAQAANKGAFLASLRLDSISPATINRLPEEQRLILDGPFEVAAGDLTPEAITSLTHDDSRFELEPEEDSIIAAFAASKCVQVTLTVLDLEWPDAERADSGAIWIEGLLNDLRRRYELRALPNRAAPSTFATADFPHSKAIVDALKPFTNRDKSNCVGVRYLPLIPRAGTDSILTDLVSTYFLARRKELLPFGVPNDSLARDDAIRSLHSLHSNADSPLNVYNGSRTVLDALIFVLDRTAQYTRVPYLINASWILQKPLDLMPSVYDPPKGLIIAAAGNEQEDVAVAKRDLPRWSMNARYVLSVVNHNSKHELTCSSSYLPAQSEAIELSRVVGFPGGRSANGEFRCGTSFAAPRVAWAIALWISEQVKVSTWDLWVDKVWRQIREGSIATTGSDYTHSFELTRFFSQAP